MRSVLKKSAGVIVLMAMAGGDCHRSGAAVQKNTGPASSPAQPVPAVELKIPQLAEGKEGALLANTPLTQELDLNARLNEIGLAQRSARDDDKERVAAFFAEMRRPYGIPSPHPDEEGSVDEDLRKIEDTYSPSKGRFTVVEDGQGRMVATAAVAPLREGVCELRKIYLHPDLRGKKLGKKLVVLMIETARRLGYSRMELETAEAMTEAIGLYKHLGFQPTQRGDGHAGVDTFMYLDLKE